MKRPLMLWPLVLCLLILSLGGGFAGGIMMLIGFLAIRRIVDIEV